MHSAALAEVRTPPRGCSARTTLLSDSLVLGSSSWSCPEVVSRHSEPAPLPTGHVTPWAEQAGGRGHVAVIPNQSPWGLRGASQVY